MSKSNYEINKAVAEKLGLIVQEMQNSARTGMTPSYHARYPDTVWAAKTENGQQSEAWEQICYTGSWADAGPIIERYGISIIEIESGRWAARARYPQPRVDHTSPKVAAMQVFLDMDITVGMTFGLTRIQMQNIIKKLGISANEQKRIAKAKTELQAA